MNSAPLYLIRHFFFHVFEFVRHWYVNSFIAIMRWLINSLESWDQTLALRVTLKHFFEPLYGDYTMVGRAIGPIFRVGRIAIALLIYPTLCIAAVFAYVFWAVIPIFVVVNIFYPYVASDTLNSIKTLIHPQIARDVLQEIRTWLAL